MLKHATGNLIDMADGGEFNVIVHGCNCFRRMGAGIAKEIRARYPGAYEADCSYGSIGEYNKLGNYSLYVGDKFVIINAYTQYDTVRQGDVDTDKFEYVAFNLILRKLAHHYKSSNIGLPYIGMGLAGGNEDLIMAQLHRFARAVTSTGGSVTLVKYEK
jgi:O-acetyl-ADP-ribose deacetylase (regulator of RNase III)